MDKNRKDQGEQKGFTIKVNGRDVTVEKDQLSFEEIVNLAFPKDTGYEQPGFRIVFSGGIPRQEEGDLEQGEELKLNKGMVINVTSYDLS